MRYQLIIVLALSGCSLVPLPQEYREQIAAIDARDAELRARDSDLDDEISLVKDMLGQLEARRAEVNARLDSSADEIANLRSAGKKETVADGVDVAKPVVGSLAHAFGGPGLAGAATAALGIVGAWLRRKEQNAGPNPAS